MAARLGLTTGQVKHMLRLSKATFGVRFKEILERDGTPADRIEAELAAINEMLCRGAIGAPDGFDAPDAPDALALRPGPFRMPPPGDDDRDDSTAAAFGRRRQADTPAAGFATGDTLGRFTLGKLLGEGGMGQVFAATEAWPMRREVAIKVVLPGTDTRRVIARFDGERRALALMQHPNVAAVFEAGTTPDGRPYFVMELVPGEAITRFADAAWPVHRAAPAAVRHRLRRRRPRPPARPDPPRPEAAQRARLRRRRRADGEGDRLRHRQGRGRRRHVRGGGHPGPASCWAAARR